MLCMGVRTSLRFRLLAALDFAARGLVLSLGDEMGEVGTEDSPVLKRLGVFT
jgi:hypothetical protein